VEEGLREVTMDAQVMVHPLMKKASQSRQAAISQRQEIRQINNSKRRISSARQATAMWDKAMDLEAQAIKSILDRYALCGFVSFQGGSEIFLQWNGVIQPLFIKQTLSYERKMYYLVVPQ